MNRGRLIWQIEDVLLNHDLDHDGYTAVAQEILDQLLPQVTTVEELEALPVGTVVRSEAGTIACRFDHKRGVLFGDERAFAWSILALPLIVVWQPQP